MNIIDNDKFPIIIDYAHNALALSQVLKAVRRYTDGNVVCVFGCGGNRSKLRRYEMGQAAAKYSDYIIVTSDNPRYEDAVLIMEDIEKGILTCVTNLFSLSSVFSPRITPPVTSTISLTVNCLNALVTVLSDKHNFFLYFFSCKNQNRSLASRIR